MKNRLSFGVIRVQDVNLWAHVGVLEQERVLGQAFLLDFKIWLDVDRAEAEDDLFATEENIKEHNEAKQQAYTTYIGEDDDNENWDNW